MNRLFAITVSTSLVLVGLSLADVAAQRNRDDDKNENFTGADNGRAQQLSSLVDAARDTYEAVHEGWLAGLSTEEEIYAWSSRWRASAVMAADNKGQRLKVNLDHLRRMQDVHRKIKALHEQGAKGGEHHALRAAAYYVAEAELLIFEAKANDDDQAAAKLIPKP